MAEDMKDEVLTRAAEARKMAISLKGVEYGGELVNQLMNSSAKMESLHGNINGMLVANSTDDTKFKKMISIGDAQLKWWDKAKAGIVQKHVASDVLQNPRDYMVNSLHKKINGCIIDAFPKTYLTILPLAPDQTAGKALLAGLSNKPKAKGKAKAKAKSNPENGREKAS